MPIIVAINKIDKANVNPERVKQQLSEQGLIPEEWGGETICVPVSAKQRQGLDELLEMILLVSELSELQADPGRTARGTVIEAHLDRGRGPVATVLVQDGTLRVGHSLICGTSTGKVRAMLNQKGERVTSAGPATPVELLGLNEDPLAGDRFQVIEDERLARQVAERRSQKIKAAAQRSQRSPWMICSSRSRRARLRSSTSSSRETCTGRWRRYRRPSSSSAWRRSRSG